MRPGPDTVEQLSARVTVLTELVRELADELPSFRERLRAVEGGWQRHGLELARVEERQRIHCEHLRCGCGERLTSETAIKSAWVGDPCIAYSLEDEE